MIRNSSEEKMANGLSDKVLLILTPSYPNSDNIFIVDMFVKAQLEEIRKYFKKIIVIAPVLFSFGWLPKDRNCMDYSYENIDVFFPRCVYIPIDWSCSFVIDNRLNVVKKLINEKQLEFDLVHAHFTWPSAYIGVKLKEIYRKPVITTIHENGEWFEREISMNHHLLLDAWKNSDALIRVNCKDVPTLKKYNPLVYAIPNGYSPAFKPTDMQKARKSLGLPPEKKIIFSLGWLISRKGFNFLIDAMKIAKALNPDIICFIGGSGPLKTELQDQINSLGLSQTITLTGQISTENLPLWMNASDIFVLASLNEGNPTVMFEALGCGKPFVGTSVGGVPEIITSEDYGLLVKPADSKDLAEKIIMAFDMNWDPKRIRAYAEQFTWENIAKETIVVYQKVSGLY